MPYLRAALPENPETPNWSATIAAIMKAWHSTNPSQKFLLTQPSMSLQDWEEDGWEILFEEPFYWNGESMTRIHFKWDSEGEIVSNLRFSSYQLGELEEEEKMNPEFLAQIHNHLREIFAHDFSMHGPTALRPIQDWASPRTREAMAEANVNHWLLSENLRVIPVSTRDFLLAGETPLDHDVWGDYLNVLDVRSLIHKVGVLKGGMKPNEYIKNVSLQQGNMYVEIGEMVSGEVMPEHVTAALRKKYDIIVHEWGGAATKRGFREDNPDRESQDGFVLANDGSFGVVLDGVGGYDTSQDVVEFMAYMFAQNPKLPPYRFYEMMGKMMLDKGLIGASTIAGFNVVEEDKEGTWIDTFTLGDSPMWVMGKQGEVVWRSTLNNGVGINISKNNEEVSTSWRNSNLKRLFPDNITREDKYELLGKYSSNRFLRLIHSVRGKIHEKGNSPLFRPKEISNLETARVHVPTGGWVIAATDGMLVSRHTMNAEIMQHGTEQAIKRISNLHEENFYDPENAEIEVGYIGTGQSVRVKFSALQKMRNIDDATFLIRQF